MPRRLLALSTILVGLTSLAPAYAGNEQDPEVQNADCRNSSATVSFGGDHIVCAGWFASDATDEDRVLRTTVQVAGDHEARKAPTRVSLAWSRSDGCREHWLVDDTVDAGVQLELVRTCPGTGRTTVVLDNDQVRADGRTVQVSLQAADLTSVGSGLVPGDRLSATRAESALLVRTSRREAGEAVTGVVRTPVGRDFVIPSAG